MPGAVPLDQGVRPTQGTPGAPQHVGERGARHEAPCHGRLSPAARRDRRASTRDPDHRYRDCLGHHQGDTPVVEHPSSPALRPVVPPAAQTRQRQRLGVPGGSHPLVVATLSPSLPENDGPPDERQARHRCHRLSQAARVDRFAVRGPKPAMRSRRRRAHRAIMPSAPGPPRCGCRCCPDGDREERHRCGSMRDVSLAFPPDGMTTRQRITHQTDWPPTQRREMSCPDSSEASPEPPSPRERPPRCPTTSRGGRPAAGPRGVRRADGPHPRPSL